MKKTGRFYELFVMAQVMLFSFWIAAGRFASSNNSSPRIRAAQSSLEDGLKTSLNMFKVDCGRYPTTAEGLKVLFTCPTNDVGTNWRGPYLDATQVPLDPWGHDYVYHFPAVHRANSYNLYSPGPDGVSDTSDDIGNWEKSEHTSFLDADFLLDIAQTLPLIIPFLFFIRLIVGMISPSFRAVAMENRLVDWIWFALAVFTIGVVLLMPKISG